MEQNPFEKSNINSLDEVLPIQKTFGLQILNKENIKDFVEKPLVEACEIFWDKNIKTLESSANFQNIQNEGYIGLDFNSLSEENKEVARKYGEPHQLYVNNPDILCIRIPIPVNESDTVDIVSDRAKEIASGFNKQKASWISGISLEEHLQKFEANFGKKYPDMVIKEKERLTQTGAWEEECKRLGNYFDTETQMAFPSEEYFKKWKEANEPMTDNKDLKNKYSQELINIVWKRLAQEGITNADDLIGTRETIENTDFEKFWQSVKNEDIEKLIASYQENKKQQLAEFEKYKGKYNEGDFVPETGTMISQDTSWWDNKISDLETLLK